MHQRTHHLLSTSRESEQPMRLGSCLVALAVYAVFGCSGSGEPAIGGNTSAGGSNAVGGSNSLGGTSASGGSASAQSSTGGATTSGGSSAVGGGASATGGTTAAGGATAAGGTTVAGGAQATGGAKAAGGSMSSGGAPATGGTPATGGVKAAGGITSAGGTLATGGAKATGGSSVTSTGGSVGVGGTTATGGAKATGGTPATGGTSTSTGGTTASSTDLWIAPNGSDSNPGTEASPLATLTGAQSKWTAGKTIWVKSGTYSWSTTQKLTKAGTASSPIKVFAVSGARPVIDFSGQARDDSSARGIQISGSYWYLKGFDVQKAGDNCIHISGSNNTIEWVSVHNCCDSGLQITGATASNNTVINCDAYENYDQTSGGENADGFAAKLELAAGNVFRGCRSWNNADDGWDLYAAPAVVVIEDCWAFLNGKLASGGGTSNGDGNGFKLGGAGGGAPHQVTSCFAMENLACGFTRNNNTSVPVLSQCGGRSDGKGEYCSLTNPSPVSFTMTGAQAKAVQRNSDGSLPAIK